MSKNIETIFEKRWKKYADNGTAGIEQFARIFNVDQSDVYDLFCDEVFETWLIPGKLGPQVKYENVKSAFKDVPLLVNSLDSI